MFRLYFNYDVITSNVTKIYTFNLLDISINR